MRPYELNKLAIWLPMKSDDIDIKAFNKDYPYRKNKLILRSTLTTPVYRYAKNFKKGETKYSLCLITDENDSDKIEKWLTNQAKKLDAKEIEPKFKMLNVSYQSQ